MHNGNGYSNRRETVEHQVICITNSCPHWGLKILSIKTDQLRRDTLAKEGKTLVGTEQRKNF